MANQWPQIDERSTMEKPNHQEQHHHQHLKCPRCDSSNTKFCYYNNYSLSQPRHFCKACKRYWTRGGTLRNVPVGGGCRKNKRVRRPAPSSAAVDGGVGGGSSVSVPTNPNTQPPHFDVINPMFYGNSSSDMNIPFSRVSGYDFQPQLNSLGLGFSSGLMSNDCVTSNSFFSNYSTTTTTTPTIASLLASSFQQHKFSNEGLKDSQNPNQFQSIEVKTEGGQSRLDWTQIEQLGFSDPSIYWNTPAAGAWHDPANIGSSVTSLF